MVHRPRLGGLIIVTIWQPKRERWGGFSTGGSLFSPATQKQRKLVPNFSIGNPSQNENATRKARSFAQRSALYPREGQASVLQWRSRLFDRGAPELVATGTPLTCHQTANNRSKRRLRKAKVDKHTRSAILLYMLGIVRNG